jgi:hypothetical protein
MGRDFDISKGLGLVATPEQVGAAIATEAGLATCFMPMPVDVDCDGVGTGAAAAAGGVAPRRNSAAAIASSSRLARDDPGSAGRASATGRGTTTPIVLRGCRADGKTDGVSDPELVPRPSWLARAVAGALVASVVGLVLTKLIGKKAGFAGMVVAMSAHELLDAPVARRLSALGL